MNKTLTAANDNDGILVLDGEDMSKDSMLEPSTLAELTSDLHVSRRYIIASSWSQERAAAYLARGFAVIITTRAFDDVLRSDLAKKIDGSRRVFIGAATDALVDFARCLKPGQRFSVLARQRQRLPATLAALAASVLFVDLAVVPIPPSAVRL